MPVLHILGVPLNDAEPLTPASLEILTRVGVLVGESRKVAARWLKGSGLLQTDRCWFLDGMKPGEDKALYSALRENKAKGLEAALFSDTGMPLLFDPGKETVKAALSLGYRLKSHPGPTSWATAACLSLWDPPFKIVGFPPRGRDERIAFLKAHVTERSHCLWMDTPYRYQPLCSQLEETFGANRQIFLAWELGKSEERLWWGTLKALRDYSSAHGLEKGEFVLITERAPK